MVRRTSIISPLQEITWVAQEIQRDLDALIFPCLSDKTAANMKIYPEEKKKIRKVLRHDIFSEGLESRWVNVYLLGAIVPYRDMEDEGKDEKIEMLSSTCIQLVSTVQRQKNQLQKQRKQLKDAREKMIKLQTYADAYKAQNKILDQENEELHAAYMEQRREFLILGHHYNFSLSRQGGISDMEALD
tara:strand:- start:95 stop:655 length:561 start_codon:yes stop_codon:yes gene_type:complete